MNTVESEIIIPEKKLGIKRKVRNICKVREHDWEGFYHDGWLFLDCIKCDAKNIQHHLKPKEIRALSFGWNPNRLFINIDKFGNHWISDGYELHLALGYLDYMKLRSQDTWARPDLKPV